MILSSTELGSRPRRIVAHALDAAIIVGGTGILGLTFTNIVVRLFANADVAWSTELTVFLMTWVTFLGAARATIGEEHMRIADLIDALSQRNRAIAEIVSDLVVLVVLAGLIWWGARASVATFDQLSTVLYFPIGLQYAALPVSSTISLCFVTASLARRLQSVLTVSTS